MSAHFDCDEERIREVLYRRAAQLRAWQEALLDTLTPAQREVAETLANEWLHEHRFETDKFDVHVLTFIDAARRLA